jgi:hypothetical protein
MMIPSRYSERETWDRVLREFRIPAITVAAATPHQRHAMSALNLNLMKPVLEEYLLSDSSSFCAECGRWVKQAGRCKECINGNTVKKRENEQLRHTGVVKLPYESWTEIRDRHVAANAKQRCHILPGVLNADVLIYDMNRSTLFNPYRGLSNSKIKARLRRAKKYLHRNKNTTLFKSDWPYEKKRQSQLGLGRRF